MRTNAGEKPAGCARNPVPKLSTGYPMLIHNNVGPAVAIWFLPALRMRGGGGENSARQKPMPCHRRRRSIGVQRQQSQSRQPSPRPWRSSVGEATMSAKSIRLPSADIRPGRRFPMSSMPPPLREGGHSIICGSRGTAATGSTWAAGRCPRRQRRGSKRAKCLLLPQEDVRPAKKELCYNGHRGSCLTITRGHRAWTR